MAAPLIGWSISVSNRALTDAFWSHVSHYFFNLYDDMTVIDEEGVELPSLQAARDKAYDAARALACAELLEGHLNLNHRIEVAEEGGRVIVILHFRDTFSIQT
jgi:hypothetical protein